MVQFVTWVSRYLLAFTFIFSGFVKGIDPLGSAYKFGDYFMAFGLDFLEPFALQFSFILCAAELFIGLLLLFRVKNLVAVWGAFLFMLMFTPLTFILAIYDPVSDCGCFGDAIILTNWETFFKNLPLFAASIFMLIHRKRIDPTFPKVYSHVIAGGLLIISFIPSFHGYNNLPLIDFRPYSIGTNIQEAMSFPKGAPLDEYKTILYYQKDGVEKEFTQDNFPWQDSTWQFVDSKSVLIQKGYTPPITDFSLTNFDGWSQTDSILNYEGYFILAVSHRLDKTNEESFAQLNELYFKARELGIGFACITASPPYEIDDFTSKTGVAFPFLLADEILLKTVVRSNPGVILLKHGAIIGKWHYKNIPESNYFEGDILSKSITNQQGNRTMLWMCIMILVLALGKILIAPFSIAKIDKHL
ncbi:MAG TPA: DoxX family protein [Bacteroidales bacterium]|nr:DoxX family protein [Bacteroidales bacterium]